MTEQLLLMNPRRRRRRRLVNRRRHRASSRRSSRRRHRIHASNPRRRHRRVFAGFRRHRRRMHASNPRRFRRRRSNPRLSISPRGLVSGYVIPAAVGAVGGIALDVAWGYAAPHLPAMLQSGWGAAAGQAGLALGLGYGLSKVLPRQRREIASGVVGALVIITYNAIKPIIARYVPSAGLRDYTDYRLGAYMPAPVVAVAPPRRLGYVSPAAAVTGASGHGAVGMSGVAAYMPDGM